jgi:hypothetical protein
MTISDDTSGHVVVYRLRDSEEPHTYRLASLAPEATEADIRTAIAALRGVAPEDVRITLVASDPTTPPYGGTVSAPPLSTTLREEYWPRDVNALGKLIKLLVDRRWRAKSRGDVAIVDEMNLKLRRARALRDELQGK